MMNLQSSRNEVGGADRNQATRIGGLRRVAGVQITDADVARRILAFAARWAP
jgi:hypothetical protein